MTPRRVFGLQGWLVGALLAVGMAASLAVLLVVLPTLESSVRERPRQARGGRARAATLERIGAGLRAVASTVTQDRRAGAGRADPARAQTGAEVRVDTTPAASSPTRSAGLPPRGPRS